MQELLLSDYCDRFLFLNVKVNLNFRFFILLQFVRVKVSSIFLKFCACSLSHVLVY